MGGDPPTSQNSPMEIGKYKLRRVVGRGSIGVVYEGWDTVLKRVVAVKMLRLIELDTPLGQEKYQRFQREAQAAARLYHPNIAITFDYGETSADAYIVMEFLDGPSLRERIENTRVGGEQIRPIMQGLLAGLQHSHDQGVIHRDIKPANILFSRDGQVKITDFGIARLDDSDLTQLGSQVGTPAYMSPEQVLGDKVDARSDIYSAGVVLYELLTGRRPFEGSTNSVMHKIVHIPAPRISESTTEFSPEIDAVVARVLAKDQTDRYQSASEFWDALSASLLASGAVAKPPSAYEPALDSTIVPGSRLAKPVAPPATAHVIPPAPRPRVGALASAAVAAGVVLVAVVWWSAHRPATVPEAGPQAVTASNQAAPTGHGGVVAKSSGRAPASVATSGTAEHPASPAPPAGAAKPPAESRGAAANSPALGSDLLAGLGGVAAGIPCSFVTAHTGGGKAVILSGVTALGEASETEIQGLVRRSVAQVAPAAPVTWNVRRIDGPFCALFDLLHPLAAPTGSRLSIGVGGADRSSDKAAGESVRVTMPGFPGSLILDAYSGDGTVHHLYPRDPAAQRLAQGAEVSVSLRDLLGPAPDERRGVLVAIASSAVLLSSPRPADEPMAGYVKDLGEALVRERTNGGSVVADAVAIAPEPPK